MLRFEEIAFKAELNRDEDPESDRDAWLLCGEDPMNRKRAIEELRKMIYERGECHPHRTDDAYLLKFLRARRSVPARAHRLMVRYYNFRDENPHLWRDVDWLGLRRLGDIFEGVLFDRPDCGRFILCRLGQWDPDTIPVDDLIRGLLLLLEIGIMQPKLQILGGTAMVDCQGLTMKHIRQLTPAIAVQAMNIMGIIFPTHIRSMHIVNCSRIFETFFYLFKKLAPVDDLWKNVYFHGYDLNSLHRYVDPECLPRRYGGCRDPVSLELWLTKIRQYKNKEFDEEMRNLGYAVD
ncbi:hypothetical protein JYU34_016111 [Plutella xylostella]|uniref:CRAL-TRIO domain-containing protein n=1 Tax=Plutella xylostella TaxID=51655 RepID=A0ABQ7Q6U9_PLUXY|nr:hypothetical protein JYU34_016111 [Plutella xylostella]